MPPRKRKPAHRKPARKDKHAAAAAKPPRTERAERGAQPGNKNALKHGLYREIIGPGGGIQDVIADVRQRQDQLTAYIDKHMATDKATLDDVVKLFTLHGQNASRLGRLLRDERALTGAAGDGIAGAIAQALDELSTEFGVEL